MVARRVGRPVSTGDERAPSEIPQQTLGRFVFGPANNRVVEEVRTADGDAGRLERAMDEIDPTAEN